MAIPSLLKPAALLLLALPLFTGCAEDEFTVPHPAEFPGFDETWVAVHGTVNHPTWSTGRFVFKVYAPGTAPTPGGGQQGGSMGGATSTPYLVGVPVGSGSVYIHAFNDVDGSMTHDATEWQACSAILTVGSEDLFGIDLVLSSPPPVCP